MCTIDKWSTTAGSHIARASCTSRVDGRPRECGTHQKLQVRDGARIAVPAAVTRGKPVRLGVEVIQQPVDAALEPLVAAQSERRPVQLVSAVRHLVEVPAREEAEGSRRGGISGTRGEQARLAQHLVVAAFIQTLGKPVLSISMFNRIFQSTLLTSTKMKKTICIPWSSRRQRETIFVA